MGASIYDHASRKASDLIFLGTLPCALVRRACVRVVRLAAARGVGPSLPSVLLMLLLPVVASTPAQAKRVPARLLCERSHPGSIRRASSFAPAKHTLHAGAQSTASIEGQVTDQD